MSDRGPYVGALRVLHWSFAGPGLMGGLIAVFPWAHLHRMGTQTCPVLGLGLFEVQ